MTGVDRATSRSRAWAFRLAALGLATVLAIAVAEVAVRVVDPFGVHYHSHIEGLRRLARWSARTPLIYENAPSTKTVIHGVEYRINSLGHRGPEPRLAVPAVRRILGVGDSVTFGAGVNQDETFLELVARRLSRPSQPWDAYNTGVVSYGIHQELEVLGIWLPRIEPAVVVHCFVANDIQRALPPLNQRFPGWQRFHGRRSPVDVWTSVDSWIAAPLLRRVTPALSDLMVHAITSRAEEANRRTLAAGGLDSETLLMESAAWRESARALKDYCQLARQHARSISWCPPGTPAGAGSPRRRSGSPWPTRTRRSWATACWPR
ncbi:MAG: hypothetical protein HY815_12970 [Candidatus Riflebacteria bacterium]|nr:hypothetical protein [Candidatus Riflebacteria bacterium]